MAVIERFNGKYLSWFRGVGKGCEIVAFAIFLVVRHEPAAPAAGGGARGDAGAAASVETLLEEIRQFC